MTKITLEIKTCKECPFFEEKRMYTSDSFERPFNWFCTKKEDELGDPMEIAGYVEWHEEKGIEVPKWCPIKIED
jgi:hypothetical protein